LWALLAIGGSYRVEPIGVEATVVWEALALVMVVAPVGLPMAFVCDAVVVVFGGGVVVVVVGDVRVAAAAGGGDDVVVFVVAYELPLGSFDEDGAAVVVVVACKSAGLKSCLWEMGGCRCLLLRMGPNRWVYSSFLFFVVKEQFIMACIFFV
jgi:hypothetical protein